MTRLLELIDRYWQGTCPVFAPGPFLSFENMRARCLRFDRVLKNAEDMAEAALLNLYLGFEAIADSVPLPLRKELSNCMITNIYSEIDTLSACDILNPSFQGIVGDICYPKQRAPWFY